MKYLYITLILFLLPFVANAQGTHVIEATNYTFSPENLTGVEVGDTIRWQWIEGSHTTTSTNIPAGSESWDSPLTTSNTEYVYVVEVAGNYEYICLPHQALGMTGSFVVNQATSVKATIEKFKVYPNPFTDFIMVENGTDLKIKQHRVLDLLGKELYSTRTENQTNMMDLSVLDPGIYLLELKLENGDYRIERIIKK